MKKKQTLPALDIYNIIMDVLECHPVQSENNDQWVAMECTVALMKALKEKDND